VRIFLLNPKFALNALTARDLSARRESSLAVRRKEVVTSGVISSSPAASQDYRVSAYHPVGQECHRRKNESRDCWCNLHYHSLPSALGRLPIGAAAASRPVPGWCPSI